MSIEYINPDGLHKNPAFSQLVVTQADSRTIYVVQGQSPQPGFEEFQRVWGNRPNLPLITVLLVAGFANPGFLVEIDAIVVIPALHCRR